MPRQGLRGPKPPRDLPACCFDEAPGTPALGGKARKEETNGSFGGANRLGAGGLSVKGDREGVEALRRIGLEATDRKVVVSGAETGSRPSRNGPMQSLQWA